MAGGVPVWNPLKSHASRSPMEMKGFVLAHGDGLVPHCHPELSPLLVTEVAELLLHGRDLLL